MATRIAGLIDEIQHEHEVYDDLLDSLIAEVIANGITLNVMVSLVRACSYFTNHIHSEEELMYLTKYQCWSLHNKEHEAIIDNMTSLIDRRKPTYINRIIDLRPLLLQHMEGFDAPLMLHARACIPALPWNVEQPMPRRISSPIARASLRSTKGE